MLGYFGYWNFGLIGCIPVGVSGMLAALLVVRKKIIVASLCFEFGRSIVPLFIMLFLFFLLDVVNFYYLVAFSYFSLFLAVPAMLAYARKEGIWCVDLTIDFRKWCKNKRAGLPIVLPQIIIVMVFQADRLFINYWGSANDLASYFAAQMLYTVVLVVVHSTFNIVIPEVSKVAKDGKGCMRSASLLLLVAQGFASLLLIPVAYVYFGFIDIDRVIAMQVMLLLMAGGLLSACFGIGLPAMQFCKRKSTYLKVVVMGLVFQSLVIVFGYSGLGLYAVVLGFVVYNISTAFFAACYWRKRAVSISPLSFTVV